MGKAKHSPEDLMMSEIFAAVFKYIDNTDAGTAVTLGAAVCGITACVMQLAGEGAAHAVLKEAADYVQARKGSGVIFLNTSGGRA